MAAKRGRTAFTALELATYNDIVSDVLLDTVIGLVRTEGNALRIVL